MPSTSRNQRRLDRVPQRVGRDRGAGHRCGIQDLDPARGGQAFGHLEDLEPLGVVVQSVWSSVLWIDLLVGAARSSWSDP